MSMQTSSVWKGGFCHRLSSPQQMTRQTLQALSAAPKSRLSDNWLQPRRKPNNNNNYQHWLVQVGLLFWWCYYMSLTNKPPICSRLNQSWQSSPNKNLTATYSVGCMEKSVPLLPKWLPLPANCLINWSLLVSTIFTPVVSLMLA